MTHDDIRRQTSLIVRRGNEYLVGYSGIFLRWSISPYDAWKTRNRRAAKMVAEKVGGRLVLFNPIIGQKRDYGESVCKNERKCNSTT